MSLHAGSRRLAFEGAVPVGGDLTGGYAGTAIPDVHADVPMTFATDHGSVDCYVLVRIVECITFLELPRGGIEICRILEIVHL